MSQRTATQIIQQNIVFQQALRSGKITKAQYDQAMTMQNADLAKVQAQNRAGATYSPTQPAAPVTQVGIYPTKIYEAAQKDPTMQNIVIPVSSAAAIAVAAPLIGPAVGISATSVLIGEGLGVGINQGFKAYQGGGLLTPQEVVVSAAEGGAFSVVGGVVLGKAAQFAPKLAGEVANPFVRAATRISINAGLGAGSSGVMSGGNPQAIVQGAAFGAAFGAVGEVAGAASGKIKASSTGKRVINKIQDNIMGSKFTEVTGVKEVANQRTFGKTTVIDQLTEPDLRTVTIRGKNAEFYRKNNLSTLQKPKVELGGTEKVYQPNMELGGVKLEPIPVLRQIESIRNADPLFAALKRDANYKLGIARTGKVSDFLETPSNLPAIQRTKVTVDVAKNQPVGIFSEKTIISSKKAILPTNKVSVREFTGVKIKGIVDDVGVADIAKSLPKDMAQNIYKQLGGNYRPIVDFGSQAPKDLSGKMKVGSNKFYNANSVTSPKGVVPTPKSISATTSKLIEAPTPQTKMVTLPRAIVAEVKGTPIVSRGTFVSAGVYPGLKQSFDEYEETQFLTMPKTSLALDKPQAIFNKTIMGTQQKQRSIQQQNSFPITFLKQPINTKPDTVLTSTPITTPKLTPVLMPKLSSIQTPRIFQKPSPKTTPIPNITSFTKQRGFPNMPGLGFGGGFDNLGPKGSKSGQWFQKTHKVKTYSQMLQTFGLGKASKPIRSLDKALSKHINKLDRKIINRSVKHKRK
jgi:hypothetical protein